MDYIDKTYSDEKFEDGYAGAYPRLEDTVSVCGQHHRVLDVGCANGYFTRKYLEKYPDSEGYGCDFSQAAIDKARKLCAQGQFRPADVYKLPYESNEFDLVTCLEVLEHLQKPDKAIEEIHRVLKPNGLFVLTVPNELAADYIEHLWQWNLEGINDWLLGLFRIIEETRYFKSEHIMYIKAQKL